jgi:hypothetical protein
MADNRKKVDQELEEFRRIMVPPSTFEDGFSWVSLFGALFVALLMVPGGVYMGLLAGEGIGPSARWVTVILFIEVARRAQKHLKRAEIFVLFYMVGAAMALPFSGLLWQQFFAQSDAATAFGIAEHLPSWYAPALESESYARRTFLHRDWLPVIGLVVFGTFFGRLSEMILGYGFFRLASDIERLPFPMAPVGAQGIMALAEDTDEDKNGKKENQWRWRVFAIGGAIGLAFGAVYLLLPTLTGALTGKAIRVIPIPFIDWTTRTKGILPAVATGISLDLGHFITGMVLPFWAVVGRVSGLLFTFILNPLLYHVEVLTSWAPGDDTIATMFKNRVDFYFSFSIGISVAIFLGGLAKVINTMAESRRKRREGTLEVLSEEYLKQRGDIPNWIVIACYLCVTMAYVLLCGWLINWHRGIMIVLCFFGFVYTPLISYVTARLEGIAGMALEIPMIREACLIFSGYEGVKVWLLPIPKANYGDNEVVFYRECELTGTKFSSIWKTQLILTPVILVSSILYMSYIWSLAPVPSSVYPYAETMWELGAANSSIMMSSTLGGEYSIFEEAFNLKYLLAGAGGGLLLFGVMSWLQAPIFLTYGVVQGLGETLPHSLILQILGACVGRYYFRRKLGLTWRQYVPVLAAGFGCGQGLIATVGVGITFLAKAVISLPY